MAKLIRPIVVVIALALAASACGDGPSVDDIDLAGDGDASSTTTAAPSTTTTSTTSTTSTSTVPPTTTTTLPPVPDPSFGELAGDGVACVGTRIGLSCLIDGDWQSWDGDNSPVWDWVQELDVCDDGTILTSSLDGVARYRDSTWSDLGADFVVTSPSAVACGAGDELWAGWFGAVAVLNDSTWTWWDTEEVLGSSEFVKGVEDIVVAPDGTAWVASRSSIARFDGTWTVWEDGAGFDHSISPSAIDVNVAADGSYTVHVAIGFRGIANFADGAWTVTDVSLNGASDLEAVGPFVFVPAFRAGVARYDGSAEAHVDESAGLSSNTARSIEIDAAGNQWIATDYGVTVLTEDGPRTYRVDNSAIHDNNAYVVAVQGAPAAPAETPEEWTTLAGVVLDNTGQPLADVMVEACVHQQRDEFDGDSPCANGSYAATVTTDETGRFELTGLRAGRYTIAMDHDDRWTYFVDGSTSAWYHGEPGEISELGVFTLG